MVCRTSLRASAPTARGQSGFTLIELMVASTILGLAVTGTLALVGSGRSLEYQNGLYAQARAAANAILEDPTYRYTNYAALGAGTASPPVTTTADAAPILNAGTTHPVAATASVTIGAETVDVSWNTMPGFAAPAIPAKRIDVTLTWNADGTDQSLTMSKQISQAK
jgi:prepilin-type N-terminal cleavage/methylation domain-containing protein